MSEPYRPPGANAETLVLRRIVASLIAALVALSLLVAAGATIVALVRVLPTLVLALALAAALLRLVWFVTSRRSS
jgi:hypothetical protein